MSWTTCHCGYAVAEELTFCPMCGRDAAGHRREMEDRAPDRFFERPGAYEWVRIRRATRRRRG